MRSSIGSTRSAAKWCTVSSDCACLRLPHTQASLHVQAEGSGVCNFLVKSTLVRARLREVWGQGLFDYLTALAANLRRIGDQQPRRRFVSPNKRSFTCRWRQLAEAAPSRALGTVAMSGR